MEFMDLVPLKTPLDANQVFMECIETAIERVQRFFDLYRSTW